MNVLVIPEDFRKDQDMLRPILAALLREAGRPRAKVTVCTDPLLRGVSEALDWKRITTIIDQYRGMTDLFLLCVDRDGDPNRRAALDGIERRAAELLPPGRALMAENAWQELEVWVLAGHDLPPEWSWSDIRNEIHPKENYFLPFARLKGAAHGPSQGRKELAQDAVRRYGRIRQLCPEDIGVLEDRVGEWVRTAR